MIKRVLNLTNRISINLFNIDFKIRVDIDNRDAAGRVFIQIIYSTSDNHSENKEIKEFRGRKFYLSEFMTDDGIIKTCYFAFETCVKHEVMEVFKVDNITLFNPHVNFEKLLEISNFEITRENK
jgi:hypothetical protein